MEREQLTALVTAAQNGDGNALNALFNEYYNDVYFFALKTVGDKDLACDITQEAFVEIIKTIRNLKEPAAFVSWMKKVTYHQCTRYFKKKTEILADEDEDGNTVFDTIEEERGEFIPEAALDKADFRKTVQSIIASLPEEQRAAVMMYYFEEMPLREIAKTQSVSEGTVKSRLNYARKAIKSAVEVYEKKSGVRLHNVAVFPMLSWTFDGAFSQPLSAASASAIANRVSAATGAQIGVFGASAPTKKAGLSTGAKIAIAFASAIAVVGLTAAAALIIPGDDDRYPPHFSTASDNSFVSDSVSDTFSYLYSDDESGVVSDTASNTASDDVSSGDESDSLSDSPSNSDEYLNGDAQEIVEGEVSVTPSRIYRDGTKLFAECYVANGLSYPVHGIRVDLMTLSNENGVIASATFGELENLVLLPGEAVLYQFEYGPETVSNFTCTLDGIAWETTVSAYDGLNQYIDPDNNIVDPGLLSVKIKTAYFDNGKFVAECYFVNGLGTTVSNIRIKSIEIGNRDTVIASGSTGVLSGLTVNPSSYGVYTITFSDDTLLSDYGVDLSYLYCTATTEYNH